MHKFQLPPLKRLFILFLTALCLIPVGFTVMAAPVQAAGGVTVNFTQAPKALQVYQRDPSTNKATVVISGEVATASQDEIIVTATHQGTSTTEDTASQTLSYSGGAAPFALSLALDAELTRYQIEVVVRNGATNQSVLTVQDVLAGDVYIINGQSNAAAQKRPGSASANTNQDIFIRSFGYREVNSEHASDGSTVANPVWTQANGDGGSGNSAVGQWGLRMAKRIVDTYGIPVGLINGAVNGSEINSHLPNPNDHEDINTIYGRLLWRTNQAGVTQNARALLWYQGEADSKTTLANDYAGKFATLYNAWQQDFTGLQHIYLFQNRNLLATCGDLKTQESIATVREAQRRFADIYGNVQTMSTTGIDPQINGCHFPYENGYEKIGDNIFRLLARDFYGSGDTQNIDAPNIDYAYFSNGATEVTIVLRDADDALVWNNGAEQDFRLEGSSTIVANGGSVSGNRIILTFPSSGSGATGISYLGHTGQNPAVLGDAWQASDDPRAGQWVTNSNGVGLLAFYNVPLNQPPTVSITEPINNTVVTLGSNVTIRATATDSDGAVAQVEFYADNALLDTDTSESYETIWNSPPAGTYLLKARAIDNGGAMADSAPITLKVNQPPTVAVTAPAANRVFAQGELITITANPADADGSMSKVEFYAGANLLCTINSAPWQCEWSDAPAGAHVLTAQATDNDGAATTSAAVNVSVNTPPAISITTPANGATFGVGANVNMAANADDSDGTVTEVVFYSNNTPLCTDTAAPWECQLPNVAAGSYTLKAVAKDNNGAATESTPVTIVVTTTPPTATPTPTNTPMPTFTPTATVGPGTPTPIPATATPVSNATLTIPGNTSGAPGSQFIVMGANFAPNAVVTLYVNGAALGSLLADGAGGFSALLVTNEDSPPGQYVVTSSGTNAAAAFTLNPEQGPVTADNITPSFQLPHVVYMPLMRK